MNFSEIPNGLMVPGFWTEIDNSAAAGSGVMPWNVLLIGSKLSGTATANVPVQIFSDDQADSLFGKGSQAALMARAFRKNSKLIPLWVAGVADGTTKASKTITITATSAKGGVIALYVGGQLVNVEVKPNDSADAVADAIVAAVTEQMPVDAAKGTGAGTVKFTAKNGGTAGNSIDIRVNYVAGEVLPSGVSITGTGYLENGAGDPDVAGVIGNIGSQWFNVVVVGFEGAIGKVKTELEERWTATVQKTGVCIFGVNSDDSTADGKVLSTLNSQVVAALPLPLSPTPAFEIAAAGAGVIAASAEADPAMPLGNVAVKGVLAPAMKDRKSLSQENAMLEAGGSLLNASQDGTVYLRRTISTYKQNAAGADDDSYLQLETIFTLSYIRWDWNNYMASKYPRAKLAKDGYEYGEGQVVLTPKKGRAEALTRFDYWMRVGVCQDAQTFADNLVVEINAQNPYRLDFLLPATLMKQLFTVASKLQFR